MRALLAALLLACAMTPVAAQDASDFRGELKAMLERSQTEKKGLVFQVQGQTIAGIVLAIHADAVVVRNQQHDRIVIRIERIDAVAAN